MSERTAALGVPGFGTSPVGTPTGAPTTGNFVMVPRCTFKVEKCTGGFKFTCTCDDKLSCSMVQNLCTMLAGGLCSCCCTYNGFTVYYCNFTMGTCRYETTENGVCVTCTSGDPQCCQMIQACCDCLYQLLEAGCTCCFLMNSTPVCCGNSDTFRAGGAPKAKTGK
jgi:hypothetical protein